MTTAGEVSVAAGEVPAAEEAEAADHLAGGLKLAEAPGALRMPLTAAEQGRLAALGTDTARALEGVLRGWQPIERECDLAARIAGALEERLIFPSVLLVGGAERRRAFRHPVPTTAMTGRDVLAVVTGVRGGLTVSCSRTVSAGAGRARPGQPPCHLVHVMLALVAILADARRLKGTAS